MTYRLLSDENVPEATVRHFDERIVDAVHVVHGPDTGSSDDMVAAVARESDRLLLTNENHLVASQ